MTSDKAAYKPGPDSQPTDPAVEFEEASSRVEAAILSGDPDRREAALARLEAATAALSLARRHEARTPSWDALLADPTQQYDREGIVVRSILTHQACSHLNRTTSLPVTAGAKSVTACPDCGLYL